MTLVMPVIACASPIATIAPEPTVTLTPTPKATSTPTYTLVSFPFTWQEGGRAQEGREFPESTYLDAVEMTVWDFKREGASTRVPGYEHYSVSYSTKYTLYKEWNDFGGYHAVVGLCLEVLTNKGHTYGKNSQSIATYYLSDFLPGEAVNGSLTFDIAADENPIELRDYENCQVLARVWKLDLPR